MTLMTVCTGASGRAPYGFKIQQRPCLWGLKLHLAAGYAEHGGSRRNLRPRPWREAVAVDAVGDDQRLPSEFRPQDRLHDVEV